MFDTIAKSFYDAGLFTNEPIADLRSKVLQFSQAGERYLRIGLRLGGVGSVWFFSFEVSRTAYDCATFTLSDTDKSRRELYLPKTGSEFDRAISHFLTTRVVSLGQTHHTVPIPSRIPTSIPFTEPVVRSDVGGFISTLDSPREDVFTLDLLAWNEVTQCAPHRSSLTLPRSDQHV
jgi:hypothetical protein